MTPKTAAFLCYTIIRDIDSQAKKQRQSALFNAPLRLYNNVKQDPIFERARLPPSKSFQPTLSTKSKKGMEQDLESKRVTTTQPTNISINTLRTLYLAAILALPSATVAGAEAACAEDRRDIRDDERGHHHQHHLCLQQPPSVLASLLGVCVCSASYTQLRAASQYYLQLYFAIKMNKKKN